MTAAASLEITDFTRIGPLLNALGDLAVVRSLTFTARDLQNAQTAALQDAFRKVQVQAAVLAAAAGRTLEGMLSANTFQASQVFAANADTVVGGFGGPGIPAPTAGYGSRELTVSASVSAVYRLGPPVKSTAAK